MATGESCPLGEARVAYTLIESARIRCEQLLCEQAESERLREIHRNLGLAGYHVSTDFVSELRMCCLEHAHDACNATRRLDRSDVIEVMFDEALAACDSIGNALAQEPGDHLHAAHLHVMAAAELLDAQVRAAHERSTGTLT